MPKKNSKAALRKKQKKQKAKAKQQNQQNKNKNKQNGNNNNSVTGDQDVLKMTDNPDEMLKEFVRDINIHNFSCKQISKFSHHQIIKSFIISSSYT